jgi:pentalenene oxygenase
LKNLFSTNAPMFFLEMIREAGNPPAIRLPLSFPGAPLFVIVNDHRTARIVLDDPLSTKWAVAYQFFDLVVGGDNLLAAEGARAKHPRKATAMMFSPENVKSMADIMISVVDEWMVRVLEPTYVSTGEALNVASEMMKLTSDIILQAAFDYKLTDEERESFSRILQTAYTEYSQRSQLNPFRKIAGWMFAEVREARRATRKLSQICQQMLLANRAKTNPNKNTFLYMIDNDAEYRNDNERVRDLLTYLIGGFDSSAYILSWMLLELARHSDVQTKLRMALESCPTEEAKYNNKILKHVVRETLRLHTVSALGSLRSTASDVGVPGTSMVIPSKSACIIPYYVIHRNASCYPNPNVFDPSRWENPILKI